MSREISKNEQLIRGLLDFYRQYEDVMDENFEMCLLIVIIYALINGPKIEVECYADIMWLQTLLRRLTEKTEKHSGNIEVYQILDKIINNEKYVSASAICKYILLTVLSKHGEKSQAIIDGMLDSLTEDSDFDIKEAIVNENMKMFEMIAGMEEEENT